MSSKEPDQQVQLQVSRAEFELVLVALRHLLASEDDPETIGELKRLIARLVAAAGAA